MLYVATYNASAWKLYDLSFERLRKHLGYHTLPPEQSPLLPQTKLHGHVHNNGDTSRPSSSSPWVASKPVSSVDRGVRLGCRQSRTKGPAPQSQTESQARCQHPLCCGQPAIAVKASADLMKTLGYANRCSEPCDQHGFQFLGPMICGHMACS